MKTSLEFIFSIFLIITISIIMSQCKSPKSPKETPAETNDTTAAVEPEKTNVAPASEKSASHTPLTLIITNLATATAPVTVGVYGTKNKFPDPKDQLKEFKFKPHGKTLKAKITDLPFGTYALAIYQDVNSNGKIDKNLLGIPTEPYAFSNNYRPTIKAPKFDDCRFDYNAKTNTVKMKMIQ